MHSVLLVWSTGTLDSDPGLDTLKYCTAELLHLCMLAWPTVESFIFFQLKYGMQCDKCESGNFENIQLSSLESGSWHLTLWQTCLIGRAKLASHSVSRHLKHFLLLFSPEVPRKRFYLQYQEAVYVKSQQNMSGRLENSGSSEPVIVALYYFQLWLWSGNLKRVFFFFFLALNLKSSSSLHPSVFRG